MKPGGHILLVVCLVVMSAVLEQARVRGSLADFLKHICERLPIHTTINKTPGDNGFRIIIQDLPSKDTFRHGETYTVVINGSAPSQPLMGVLVEATATDKLGETYVAGEFNTSIDSRVQDLKEDRTCDRPIIAHRYLMKKHGVKFLWTAPYSGNDCIHFYATVIEHSEVWYKDEGNLHRVICPEAVPDEAVYAINDPPGPPDQECCACGHATYRVEFQGLWSRNTHPKGFPEEKYAYQLHWSNIVGASHGNDYRIWDYGHLASRAVKEVCEYGSSRSLENEMKENSGKIRTVIKTKQLWGPEAILDAVSATFTTNKQQHLLSLITMIGPSPDWCLGISKHSMCTSNCTWVDNLSFDLYPWDAGTDSRITYLGRKVPTEPPELIHRLNSSYPRNSESPFYGVELRPFARLTVTKNKEACTDDDGGSHSEDTSPTTEELASMMKKKMMMKKQMDMEKCAVGAWGDWSDCSSSCGAGVRERRRMLKNPSITVDMCDLELEESLACTGDCKDGRKKKMHENFVMRHDEERDLTDMCGVTGWSDWSPCSATCGLGMKERWRMFLHSPEKRVNCGVFLVEKDLCRGEIFDCQKALMMKNFTVICQQPSDVGPCRGDFPRWFYNHIMQKCQPFSYGGCRGNENRFELEEDCVNLCAEHMAEIFRQEQRLVKEEMEKQQMMEKQKMMAQQEMMEKQKTMEEDMKKKQTMKKKERMAKKERNDDPDEDNEELKKKMMMQKETNTEDESNVASNVGKQGKTTMPKKQMSKKERKNKKRRKQKSLPVNDGFGNEENYEEEGDNNDEKGQGPAVDCMMTPWSDWSECSVTCGVGVITKTRMIKVEPRNGGDKCKGKLLKKKKCRQRQCPVNCEMSEWSEWSPCTETCGTTAIQIRRRQRVQRPLHGGLPCPSKEEKQFCNVPMCQNAQNRIDSMRKADFFIS